MPDVRMIVVVANPVPLIILLKQKKKTNVEFVIAERCQKILLVVELTGSMMEKEEMCNIFEA